jgi:hypothetical protein
MTLHNKKGPVTLKIQRGIITTQIGEKIHRWSRMHVTFLFSASLFNYALNSWEYIASMVDGWMNEYAVLVKWRLEGKGETLGVNLASVPLFPTQILHGLLWCPARASGVRGRGTLLWTDWGTGNNFFNVCIFRQRGFQPLLSQFQASVKTHICDGTKWRIVMHIIS